MSKSCVTVFFCLNLAYAFNNSIYIQIMNNKTSQIKNHLLFVYCVASTLQPLCLHPAEVLVGYEGLVNVPDHDVSAEQALAGD